MNWIVIETRMNTNHISKAILLFFLHIHFNANLTLSVQFNSSFQNKGQLELLGPIIKLNTGYFYSPKDYRKVSARFGIYNRRHSLDDIPFYPNDVYCSKDPSEYGAASCIESKYYSPINKDNFNPNLKTIIIVPGYRTGDRERWMQESKYIWLQIEDANIILVTWKDGNSSPLYENAVANTPIIARQITIFLHHLAELNNFRLMENDRFLKNIHYIGHSLGAHIGGFVGQDLRGRMGRITALDPAGPSFEEWDRGHRLDKTDATFVSALHTNAGEMKLSDKAKFVADALFGSIVGVSNPDEEVEFADQLEDGDVWFGMHHDVAHVDYYANSGKVQPGCSRERLIRACSHGRATELFVETLRYELQSRRLTSNKSYLKYRRPLTIKAADYNQFSNGTNLLKYCPDLLDSARFLKSFDRSAQRCLLPFDLITPVDELVREFSQNGRIDFVDTASVSSNRYYFKTSEDVPFIGDQYLLKVKIDGKSTIWSQECSLRVELQMADETKDLIPLKQNSLLNQKPESNIFELIIPFVRHNNLGARNKLDYILTSCTKISCIEKLTDYIREIIPSSIRIWIYQIESKPLKDIILESIKLKKEENPLDCRITIESINIQPIIDFNRVLVGDYCLTDDCKHDKLHVQFHNAFAYQNSTSSDLKPNPLTIQGRSVNSVDLFHKLKLVTFGVPKEEVVSPYGFSFSIKLN